MFEHVRFLQSEQRGVWCTVDFEAWDMDHLVNTQFGWSTLRWIGGDPVEDIDHVMIKQLKERIHNMTQSMATPGPLFLVFHDNVQDIKYLRSPENKYASFFLLESCTEDKTSNKPKTYIVDTSELFAALGGDSGGQKRSLEHAREDKDSDRLRLAMRTTILSLPGHMVPRRGVSVKCLLFHVLWSTL